MTKSSATVHIRIITVLVVLFAAALFTRLYFVQIVYGDTYSQQANRQYVAQGQQLYDRGSIFLQNRDGSRVSAATLKTGFTVAIIPETISDPERVYSKLSKVLDLDRDTFLARASKTNDPYERIASEVSPQTAERIRAFDLDGVQTHRQRWRFYPGADLAARTIGFVAYDGDVLEGRYGLERSYNGVLERSNDNLYVNFFAEIFTNLNRAIFDEDTHRAGDVITSIEPSVQLFLQEQLTKVQAEWGSTISGGIVLDPQDGSVHAMAVRPAFNLNAFGSVDDQSLFSNPLVEGVYEFGSIVKPLTMAAGLDADAVTPETTYIDKGYVQFNKERIANYDGEGRGRVDMQTVLNQSLNTGAAYVVEEMGNRTFAQYLRTFGLGGPTGIDLPNEARGLLSNLNSPRDIEYATASFGQGIAMTPIATARALAALGNGGTLVTPHVAERIEYRTGLSKTVSPDTDEQERVISEHTSDVITRMLVTVVDEKLGGGDVALPNYSIAAKTGTAQIAKQDERGYDEGKFLHSFFGYFPAYNPRFLVFLYTVEPQGVRFASQTLTTPFMDTAKFLINHYDVPPDR